MFFRILSLIGLAAACSDSEYVTKWTLWDGGLAATVQVPVTQDVAGWVVGLELNKQFSKIQFFNGLTKESAGASFNVTNEPWSGHKKQGDKIKFSLLGDYQDDSEDSINISQITLNGATLCNEAN